jgi:hypothetical protein
MIHDNKKGVSDYPPTPYEVGDTQFCCHIQDMDKIGTEDQWVEYQRIRISEKARGASSVLRSASSI